jgi:hypothetical protein
MDDIRNGTCPLCRHNKILERRSEPEGFREIKTTNPLAAYLPQSSTAVAYGRMRRCVCLRCGFLQEFVESPELLPQTSNDRVIAGPEAEGPYR